MRQTIVIILYFILCLATTQDDDSAFQNKLSMVRIGSNANDAISELGPPDEVQVADRSGKNWILVLCYGVESRHGLATLGRVFISMPAGTIVGTIPDREKRLDLSCKSSRSLFTAIRDIQTDDFDPSRMLIAAKLLTKSECDVPAVLFNYLSLFSIDESPPELDRIETVIRAIYPGFAAKLSPYTKAAAERTFPIYLVRGIPLSIPLDHDQGGPLESRVESLRKFLLTLRGRRAQPLSQDAVSIEATIDGLFRHPDWRPHMLTFSFRITITKQLLRLHYKHSARADLRDVAYQIARWADWNQRLVMEFDGLIWDENQCKFRSAESE